MAVTRLPNGIRILSETLPDLASVTVGIWVENGSRYEQPREAGLSHFLEHLFFKGTARRSAARIAEEIDAVGGVLNAFTGKEYTCYYAKVLAEHVPLALDLLSDMFTQSQFAAEEIERERPVVLQEIAQVEDTPDEWVHDLFAGSFWSEHPLGRPIAGSAATVSQFTRDDVLRFYRARYGAPRVLVSAAGRVDHEALVDGVGAHLAALDGDGAQGAASPPVARGGRWVHQKALEQAHVCLGVPAVSQTDPTRYAAHLLNLALGGGMSSRLFQEIRERRGKAYSVYSFLSSYADSGYWGAYVGTSARDVPEVVDAVRAEVAKVVRDGLGPDELSRTKTQMKGSVLLGLETSDSRMGRLARNEMFHGRDVPLSEVAADIDRVTGDDIAECAQRLFGAPFALTLLGDLDGIALDGGVVGG